MINFVIKLTASEVTLKDMVYTDNASKHNLNAIHAHNYWDVAMISR